MLVADIQGKRIYRIPAPDKRLDKTVHPKSQKARKGTFRVYA